MSKQSLHRHKKTPNTQAQKAMRRMRAEVALEAMATPKTAAKADLRAAAEAAYEQWKNKAAATPLTTLDDYLGRKG